MTIPLPPQSGNRIMRTPNLRIVNHSERRFATTVAINSNEIHEVRIRFIAKVIMRLSV